jgi:hypothetical protein
VGSDPMKWLTKKGSFYLKPFVYPGADTVSLALCPCPFRWCLATSKRPFHG